MRRYRIFLLIIHALAFTFLVYFGVHEVIRHSNDDTWGWLLPPLIPFLILIFVPALISFLTLIYIWKTIKFDDQELAALKAEKEKLETIKSIKELRKELGEE